MERALPIDQWLTSAWRRVAQFRAHVTTPPAVTMPESLTRCLNASMALRFQALDAADQAHLVEVAASLAAEGAGIDLVTAGLLHDIGKAIPGQPVRVTDRVALVLLKRFRPAAIRRLTGRTSPSRLGAGLWVLARHAETGARYAAAAGYNDRVQWLIANHEQPRFDDPELRALIAADNRSAGYSRR